MALTSEEQAKMTKVISAISDIHQSVTEITATLNNSGAAGADITALKGNILQKTGNQTVTGNKTFTDVRGVTPSSGDSSTRFATTEFVAQNAGSGTSVMSDPTINGNDTIAIGYSSNYSVSSSSLLQNTSIAKFYVTFAGTEHVLTASDNSASIALTMSSGTTANTVLTISVIAEDEHGNKSRKSTKDVTAFAAHVNQPTVSVSKSSMYPNESLTLTGSSFSTEGLSDTHEKTLWELYDNSACTGTPVWRLESATDKTTTTIAADTLNPGTWYAVVSYDGNTLAYSTKSAPVTVIVQMPYVNVPTIQSPTEGADIMRSDGLSVVLSDMTVTGGSDTLKQSIVKLYDSSSNTPFLTKTSNTSILGVSSAELGEYTMCRLKAQQEGNAYGLSGETGFRTILVSDAITFDTMKGYRSANGIAFTIEYPDWTTSGTMRKMEVIDAQYRPIGTYQFGTIGSNSTNPRYAMSCLPYGVEVTDITNDLPSDCTLTKARTSTEFMEFSSDLTATQLCNNWLKLQSKTDSQGIKGVPAVIACVGISGGSWLLPNIYQLYVLWLWSDRIDENDPTAASYPAAKIGKTHANGRFRREFFWSSTDSSNNECYNLTYKGGIGSTGKANRDCVLPIRELGLAA